MSTRILSATTILLLCACTKSSPIMQDTQITSSKQRSRSISSRTVVTQEALSSISATPPGSASTTSLPAACALIAIEEVRRLWSPDATTNVPQENDADFGRNITSSCRYENAVYESFAIGLNTFTESSDLDAQMRSWVKTDALNNVSITEIGGLGKEAWWMEPRKSEDESRIIRKLRIRTAHNLISLLFTQKTIEPSLEEAKALALLILENLGDKE